MNSAENNSKALNTPPALTPGDTLGIVAPASPFNQSAFEKGVAILQSFGFKVRLAEELFLRRGYLAGSDRDRADLLMHLLMDEHIQGVVCARGGFGSMKLLPLLDYERLRPFSKIFIGFSDITALLVNLVEKCRWVVFHGPTVTTLGTADSQTLENFRLTVCGKAPLTLRATNGTTIMPGCATGKLMVGNLTTLCHLVGTPYLPDFSGSILLLEDRGEAPYRIDRMLTQMKLAGCFNELAGLALGSFMECGDVGQVEAIAATIFSDCRIPILGGFTVGHADRNFTLPLGLAATLDTRTQTLRLLSMPTVSSKKAV